MNVVMAPDVCGFDRKSDVPQIMNAKPRLCPKCDKWFAAGKRQRICDHCSPAYVRTRRAAVNAVKPHVAARKAAAVGNDTRTHLKRGKAAGQKAVKSAVLTVFSAVLNLTFVCPVSDPRAASLDCRVLAYEEAARNR